MTTGRTLAEKNPELAAGSRPALSGAIFFDPEERIQWAIGVGKNAALQSRVQARDCLSELRRRRLLPLSYNGREFIVLWAAIDSGELLLITEAPGAAAFEFITTVDFAYDILNHLVSDPFDAMTVVDADAKVAYISPVHERFFGHEHGEAIGKPVQEVIENTRLHEVVRSGKSEVGIIQHMRGASRIVNRTPIFRGDKLIGAIGRIMFKGPEQLDALSRRINALESEVEFYKREAEALRRRDYGIDAIIGESTAMQRLKQDVIRVAPLDVGVLITGESGSGKELVAQALHRLSPRRDKQLVMVNAAALPASLVESELFGYVAGAFTGARQKGHKGKFEQADQGTLFLDEIGDMPLEVQAKLLRVLQDGLLDRVGSASPVKVDFRLITATNRDLERLVAAGDFRLDLFYRISTVVLHVPPLRERVDDIPQLAAHFLKEFTERHRRAPMTVEPDFFDYLQSRPWPGNVRQLKHEVERAVIFAADGRLRAEDLTARLESPPSTMSSPLDRPQPAADDLGGSFKGELERVQNELIRDAMIRCKGNKKRVAEVLGISRSYLYKKLAEIGME